jgi:hypothetical protein
VCHGIKKIMALNGLEQLKWVRVAVTSNSWNLTMLPCNVEFTFEILCLYFSLPIHLLEL